MNVQSMYTAIDVHVAGEAFRIIKDIPFMRYSSLAELQERLSYTFMKEIKVLLQEPRGFAGMSGCIIVPPTDLQADVAVLFINQEGIVPLHYGGIVASLTVLLESGQLKQKETNQYTIETVLGLFSVTAIVENHTVVSVTLISAPCHFVQKQAAYTLIQADYLYAVFQKPEQCGEIDVTNLPILKEWMRTTYDTYFKTSEVQRVVLMDDSNISERRIKTITFRNDEYIVRSPGFGSTMACYMSALSSIDKDYTLSFINESIFHSSLVIQKIEKIKSGDVFAIQSRGFITGMQTFLLEETDPFPEGFLLK